MRYSLNVYFQRINFVISLALVLLSPILSVMYINYHMLASISFLALFPYLVALAYLESIERVKLTYSAPLGLLILISPKCFGLAPLTAGIISLFYIRRVRLPSLRNSAIVVTLSLLIGGILLLFEYSLSIKFAIHFVTLYDVLMIYGVSIHSLPNTFGERSDWKLAPVAIATLLLSYIIPYLLFISMIIYFIAAKYYKIKAFYERIKRYKGIARAGNTYLLVGSFTSVLGLLTVLGKSDVQMLHYLLIGFVAPHIFTHLPLMIPAILRIRAFKSYCLWTFALLAFSTITWPSWLSMLLFFLAMVCLVKSYLI